MSMEKYMFREVYVNSDWIVDKIESWLSKNDFIVDKERDSSFGFLP
jgi:hypothetical protein